MKLPYYGGNMFAIVIFLAAVCVFGYILLIELFNYLEENNKMTNKENINIMIRFITYLIYTIIIALLADHFGQVMDYLF